MQPVQILPPGRTRSICAEGGLGSRRLRGRAAGIPARALSQTPGARRVGEPNVECHEAMAAFGAQTELELLQPNR